MGAVIIWAISVFVTWCVVSFFMFIFSMGQLSPLNGATLQHKYWKWSIVSSVALNIPFLGWIYLAYVMFSKFSQFPANKE